MHRAARDVGVKLRVTAALLGGGNQKELCAAFRRVNPLTEFDLGRSYKWIEGRSLPRSPRIYEDWVGVLGLEDHSADWLAACTLDAFVEVLCVRNALDRATLLHRAGIGSGGLSVRRGGARHAAAAEDYICGTFACYSHAQSPYYRGRIIRGALVIAPDGRRAGQWTATYSQSVAGGRAHATGSAVVSGRALALSLGTCSSGVAPLAIHLLLPTPPASLLIGLLSGFVMVDPGGQPAYATRIALLRMAVTGAVLEDSNRYLNEADAATALKHDLTLLGLHPPDPSGSAKALAEYLTAEEGIGTPSGSLQTSTERYATLAATFDRVWLDTLGAPAHGPVLENSRWNAGMV